MSRIERALVLELAALLEETGLTEIEYAQGDWRVRLARHAAAIAVAPAPTPAPAALPVRDAVPDASHPGAVPSPMVGTAFLAREPGSAPFVKIGQAVREGETLLLIEAMKTYNEVRAPRAGKVARILVGDGTPVEFGETLLILE
ncbi:MAG: acetyl-CoA carboxylase biotin carboxyl carrier protein [Alphaproteobacteria bacterium]